MFKVFTRLSNFVRNLRTIVSGGLRFFAGVWRRRTALAAENLFLRKQLALFREREKKAMPTTPADRFVFSKLARCFDWRSALMIVKPATLIGWHRNAFRLFWRWKSRPVGRPRVTVEVRDLIRRLAAENPTWGEKRIADELLLKLQIRLSPRTVAKYCKQRPRPRGSRDQRWSSFLKNHVNAIVACDFFTVVTACFRVVYVFVALEIGSRRLIHFNPAWPYRPPINNENEHQNRPLVLRIMALLGRKDCSHSGGSGPEFQPNLADVGRTLN